MKSYKELQAQHQERYNALPFRFAFSKKQLAEAMQEMGVKHTGELRSLSGTGGFYKATDGPQIAAAIKEMNEEHRAAIEQDKDGTGYIYDMFFTEMANHEYCLTSDLEPVLSAARITIAEINSNAALKAGLKKAETDYLKAYD